MDPELDVYREAADVLALASRECLKPAAVDILVIQENVSKCAHSIDKLLLTETDETRRAGLVQLSSTLAYQQDVLASKIQSIQDGSVARMGPGGDAAPMPGAERDPFPPAANNSGPPTPNKDDKHEARVSAISDTIMSTFQLSFADVAGLHDAKQALQEAIIMPLHYPQLFTGGLKPWRRILLYGPPGTGKSRLAQAVSSEIQRSTFYCVSSSDLVSSWVGESEKLIKELFQHAASQTGRSVIFIDEIDSICRKRRAGEEEHTRRIKTELLKQMEGADNSDSADRLFLLCATNCPWELDSAFLRRFQKRIYIPLPDRESRRQLIQLHCNQTKVQLSDADWEDIVDSTEGYSGSDIATLVQGALFEPVRKMSIAAFWRRTEDGHVTPCNFDDPGAFPASFNDLPPHQVQAQGVRLADLKKSLADHRKTVTTEELKNFQVFTQSFGQNG